MECAARYGLWLVAGDGTWKFAMMDCGRWACIACGPQTLVQIAEHLAWRLNGSVWAGEIAPEYATESRAKQRLRKNGGEYVYLTLRAGAMLAVAERPGKGHGWALRAMGGLAAAEWLAGYSPAVAAEAGWADHPVYTWWSDGWRPVRAESAGRYIGGLRFENMQQLREIAGIAGVTLAPELKDPADAFDRIRVALRGEDAPEVVALLESMGGKLRVGSLAFAGGKG